MVPSALFIEMLLILGSCVLVALGNVNTAIANQPLARCATKSLATSM